MTIIPFTPTLDAVFQFQPTLDGSVYNATVTWSFYGQRYYLNVYSLSRVLVVSIALVGCPLGNDLNLVGGYFTTSKLLYRVPANQFEITP